MTPGASHRGGVALAASMVFAVAAAPSVARAAADVVSVAIVVGSNKSPSASLENLRFGDDDAVQNARTFQLLGAETTLLVSLDAETRALFPATRADGAATQAALRSAFARASASLGAARAAGRRTRLYFLFAGHGDIDDGRPFLQLDDGRLWREDLAEMLRQGQADDNHVLVDACYGATFVAGRGAGGQRTPLEPGFSQRGAAAWPPRTGFLTARSSGGQTHEWAEFQAGVFSHELRSGLVGAADVDLDGAVSYREIAAFVRRANEAVPNHRYRPQVSTTAPGGDLDTTLADLPAGPLVLEMDLGTSGRTFVETETGIRLADLHTAPGTPIHLRLPTDLGRLFVQHAEGRGGAPHTAAPPREFGIAPRTGRVQLSALASEGPRVRARGAAHEAFLLLFARPFDQAAVAEFQLEPSDRTHGVDAAHAAASRSRRVLTVAAFSLGAASAVAAGAMVWSASSIRNDPLAPDAPQTVVVERNDAIRRRNLAAWTLAGVGGAALVTGIILALWPQTPAVLTASRDGAGDQFTIRLQKRF